MKMTFRWYGENSDTVRLSDIRQIPGMTGIMGFLDYKAAGEVWTDEEIGSYVAGVHKYGLECEVIESVNVHEDIKLGLPDRDLYIDNYIKTIRNLAGYGIKVIIYNFMPVFDWLRTDVSHENPDGSRVLYYDEDELGRLTPADIVRNTLNGSGGFTLPGWEPERLSELEQTLDKYSRITKEDVLENYRYFLERVIPVCEECNVTMAVHPDDPGWDIFGLPRVVHSIDDLDRICSLYDSPRNGICLCTGSLGSNPDNDVVEAIRHFGKAGRIPCLHVRNVRFLGYHKFSEAAHLSRTGDLDMYRIMKAIYDCCPDAYIRPDHGRMIFGETGRPGYGLYDRALGSQYLEGLWEAISKSENMV